MATKPQRSATATFDYTASVTATILALMGDRGSNPTRLSAASGVPRRTLDNCLFNGHAWKTSHLEAIAVALDTDLASMVAPRLRAS